MKRTAIELFAGVGGFRVGLNEVSLNNNIVLERKNWDFLWANQWEPSTKSQPAYECYVSRFGNSKMHVNVDISKINTSQIPDFNLLLGGFPCQDYSVARSLSKEKGIEGKKGVLWWEIYRILKNKKPAFALLENVDRLLKSPSKQRGRDFGIMLKSLDELGYSLEWRVINAADYGAAQRRRRVFLFAFHKSTKYYKTVTKLDAWVFNNGLFAKSFPIEATPYQNRISEYTFDKSLDLVEVSNTFSFNFYNTGILHRGKILTIHTTPIQEKAIILKNILEDNVDKKFFLTQDNITKHKYLKGSKKIKRTRPNGKTYFYSEGSMNFPDSLEKPGRTMLTSEGTINRSSHVIKDPQTGIIRKITPVEAERLNGFPDNWTNTGMTDRQRYFMMGNALVVPIVTKIGKTLSKIVDNE